jgi:hypothetical protein
LIAGIATLKKKPGVIFIPRGFFFNALAQQFKLSLVGENNVFALSCRT